MVTQMCWRAAFATRSPTRSSVRARYRFFAFFALAFFLVRGLTRCRPISRSLIALFLVSSEYRPVAGGGTLFPDRRSRDSLIASA